MQSAGRWDDTVLVFTSDHGQALGEHGFLFHALQVSEPIARVPLWYRHPSGRQAGTTGVGVASLMDVLPTVLEDAGVSISSSFAGTHLTRLATEPRSSAVYASSDGLHERSVLEQLTDKAGVDRLDRVVVAAYDRQLKVTWDSGAHRARAYQLDIDPGETADMFDERSPQMASLAHDARHKVELIEAARRTAQSRDVDDRLTSWGYV